MTSAYCFNANRFKNLPGEDVRRWNTLFELINFNVTFIDRTGGITMPIRSSFPKQLAMPTYDPQFSMTYEECCQFRAREILAKQEQLDVPIRLLYSGGIDSSLILTSFIKEIGLAETEKRVQIVLSVESIEENPWMWERVLRRSNFAMINGEKHASDWSRDRILVGGEFNDQLMGSDLYKDIVRWKGNGILNQPWTDDLMTEYYMRKLPIEDAEMWTRILGTHLRNAPCPVDTVADWWWWINFSCKWSSVYFRILMYARDYSNIDETYLNNYYYQFFGDDNFQKWSMVNRTQKINGSWDTYKWHARQLVADFCGQEYTQKMKRGSLWRLLGYKRGAELIDSNYNYIMDVNAEEWYEPNNSFKNA